MLNGPLIKAIQSPWKFLHLVYYLFKCFVKKQELLPPKIISNFVSFHLFIYLFTYLFFVCFISKFQTYWKRVAEISELNTVLHKDLLKNATIGQIFWQFWGKMPFSFQYSIKKKKKKAAENINQFMATFTNKYPLNKIRFR